jgi:hypothetical protein
MTEHNDSRMQDESQVLSGSKIYDRAMHCAGFSPIETRILDMVVNAAWLTPRLAYGLSKAMPVKLEPNLLAEFWGVSRSKVYASLARLRAGSVLIPQESGRWLPNAYWREWMDDKGRVLIAHSCYGYVETGLPPDHICQSLYGDRPFPEKGQAEIDTATPSTQPVPLSDVPPPSPTGDRPFPEKGQANSHVNGEFSQPLSDSQVRRPVPQRGIESPVGDSPYCDTGAPPREDKSLSDSACTEFKSNLRDNNLSISSIQAPNKPALMDSPGNAKCTHGDNPGTNLECTQSRERYINPSTNLSDLEPFENPPPIPGPVMPSPQASMHPTALEGDKVPDMPTLDRAIKLSDRHFSTPYPINDGILRFRYVYESAWILKAIRRTILLNVNPRKFGYVHSILQGWFAVGRPDVGIEDGYDDDLRPLAGKPFVPVAASAGNQNGYSAAPKNFGYRQAMSSPFGPQFASEREKRIFIKRAQVALLRKGNAEEQELAEVRQRELDEMLAEKVA